MKFPGKSISNESVSDEICWNSFFFKSMKRDSVSLAGISLVSSVLKMFNDNHYPLFSYGPTDSLRYVGIEKDTDVSSSAVAKKWSVQS